MAGRRPMSISPLPGSGPMQPVSGTLKRLAAQWGLAESSSISRVVDGWAALVGAEIAAHSRPESIRQGVLRVVATDAAVVEYLRWSSTDLVNALRRQLRVEGVESIEVVLNDR